MSHLDEDEPRPERYEELPEDWDYDEDSPFLGDLVMLALMGMGLIVLTPWLFDVFVAMWWLIWPA